MMKSLHLHGAASLMVLLVVLIACGCGKCDPTAPAGAVAPPATANFEAQIINVPPEILRHHAARVVCNGGEYVTFSRNDGSIVLHDLPAGVHLVDIYLLDYVFPELRVDVSKKVKGRIRVAYNDGSKIVLDPLGRSHGEALGDGAVSVAPIARHKFFIPREEFSVMSIFKNPMILLSLVSVGLFYIMPKDEMKKASKDLQKMASDIKKKQ